MSNPNFHPFHPFHPSPPSSPSTPRRNPNHRDAPHFAPPHPATYATPPNFLRILHPGKLLEQPISPSGRPQAHQAISQLVIPIQPVWRWTHFDISRTMWDIVGQCGGISLDFDQTHAPRGQKPATVGRLAKLGISHPQQRSRPPTQATQETQRVLRRIQPHIG